MTLAAGTGTPRVPVPRYTFSIMKTLVFARLLACAVPFAASAQSPSGDQMRPDERMVQAVQYPYDWKVKFDPLFSTGRAKDVSGTAEVKRKKEIEVEVKIDAPPPSTLK